MSYGFLLKVFNYQSLVIMVLFLFILFSIT